MEPYRECPSFDVCSCNLCPLDPDAHRREALPGEEECRAHRSTRAAIAARHPELHGVGLLPRERAHDNRSAAAKAARARMPEDHPSKVAGRALTAMRKARSAGYLDARPADPASSGQSTGGTHDP